MYVACVSHVGRAVFDAHDDALAIHTALARCVIVVCVVCSVRRGGMCVGCAGRGLSSRPPRGARVGPSEGGQDHRAVFLRATGVQAVPAHVVWPWASEAAQGEPVGRVVRAVRAVVIVRSAHHACTGGARVGFAGRRHSSGPSGGLCGGSMARGPGRGATARRAPCVQTPSYQAEDSHRHRTRRV